jgi:hypothetical protein
MDQNDWYPRYRFSITCLTDDLAVLSCLRALCQWAEKGVYRQIGWGGTTETSWERSGGRATLRFTDAAYRQDFIDKAEQLLADRWSVVEKNDQDPATRQRKPH